MLHRWSEAAETRRRQIESGLDLTFSKVFVPYFREILTQLKPTSVLEVGGGTGHLARSLSDLHFQYVVIEPSPGMCDVASEVLRHTSIRVEQSRLEDFSSEREFEVVMSHMCLQTVSGLSGFMRAVAKNLSRSGSFLLSLPHPTFYNDYKGFFPKPDFQYTKEHSKQVSFSITLDPNEAINDVPYHHRSISVYVAEMAAAGLCPTRLDEIFPNPEIQKLYGKKWESPRYLVFGGGHLLR